MNTNKNFFDELDKDWGEVLSNTYKEASEPILSFDLVDKYKFLWKPSVIKESRTLDFQILRKNFSLEDAKTFNYTNIKLINKNYKIDVFETKTEKYGKLDSFTIYTSLADVIVSSDVYNTYGKYTDIIKNYLGDDNVNFLNNCNGFEVTYDGFIHTSQQLFYSLDEFFNNEEWLEIYMTKDRKLKNMIFHYMGDYETNLLKNSINTKPVVDELYKKANKL